MARVRTAYSFRAAVGKLEGVMKRLIECGYAAAPITDRASTFGFSRWSKLASKHNLKPVFGLELAVTESVNAKKPIVDYWTFIAKDNLLDLHKLFEIATSQFRYESLLTYQQAQECNLFKIVGYRSNLDLVKSADDLFVGLSPSCSKGYLHKAIQGGFQFVKCSDNKFTNPDEQKLYEVICGKGASSQSYDQFIQTDDQWMESIFRKIPGAFGSMVVTQAKRNMRLIFEESKATLKKGEFPTPEKPKTLLMMCQEGAKALNINLEDPIYKARLEKELRLIDEKKFENYFYIVADLCKWARSIMLVGGARGSSCGSLVCYLLEITTIDPIPYGLIFERFIDVHREDLPDIDIDFSDQQRHKVFEYLQEKYGADHVAKLGTVATFKPDGALNEVGKALKIPKWEIDGFADSILKRSGGDARALDSIGDNFKTLKAGQELLAKYPEMIIAEKMEGCPTHYSQHASGIILTKEPVNHYVAVDMRTGATQCDKKDAEDLNLLKIDVLGLTQLSVFEDALELAKLDRLTLEKIPMDDPEAFKVIRDAKFSGIFQFNGMALQSIVKQFHLNSLDDIVCVTALARPGPLASGGAHEWVRRKNKVNPVIYPHQMFEPDLKDTLGIVLYQEQVMNIGRNIGDLSWADVTQLRKSMSKSLGKEYFNQWGDKWKAGAAAKGCDPKLMDKVWDELCSYGSWCLDGNTKIKIAYPGTYTKSYTPIKELYKKYVSDPSNWTKNRMPVVLSLQKDGKIRPQKVSKILKNGKKECFEFSFDNGSKVCCTLNHKFIINDVWKEIGSSKIGDSFSFGKRITIYKGKGLGHLKGRTYKGCGFPSGKKHPGFTTGAKKIVSEFREKNNGKPCEDCGKIKKRMHSHHNDFSGGSKEPHNISWICSFCHTQRHKGKINKISYKKGLSVLKTKLLKKKYIGLKETYDLQMPKEHNFLIEGGLITHNSFNKSHAVAYGIISYQCAWLKAHYPFEFAAATLTHENIPDKQLKLLREMVAEGYDYVPVDAEISTDKWSFGYKDGKRFLVGPITNVKGIGPKTVDAILAARAKGQPLPAKAQKLLANPITPIDSLYPVSDAFKRLLPNPEERQIFTKPTPIIDVQIKKDDYEVLIFCKLSKINPRDEMEAVNIARRGGKPLDKMPHLTASLNLQATDDTDTIFCKITRFDFQKIGKEVVDRGREGKCLYAIKGKVRGDQGKGGSFRMILVKGIRYIGDMSEKELAVEKVQKDNANDQVTK